MFYTLKVLILILGFQQIHGDGVKVSLYYEALCPDSIKFIDHQLFPTYKSIGNYIKVDLIPFGFANVTNSSGKLHFTCQHGPKECYGNKIQSCAIALYSVEESTEFVYCAMNSNDSSSDENLEKCANSSDVSWTSLQSCYSSGQADKLLEKNGIRTQTVEPTIKFVPTVIFNDHYNDTIQNEALTDFKTVVCKLLDFEPVACNDNTFNHIEVKLL